jgi:hypothetical protein
VVEMKNEKIIIYHGFSQFMQTEFAIHNIDEK